MTRENLPYGDTTEGDRMGNIERDERPPVRIHWRSDTPPGDRVILWRAGMNGWSHEYVPVSQVRGAVDALDAVQTILDRIEIGNVSDQDAWDGIERALATYRGQ